MKKNKEIMFVIAAFTLAIVMMYGSWTTLGDKDHVVPLDIQHNFL